MHLRWLHVHNFRNLADVYLDLSPGFNYVYGPNGAGKTALLEAIYFLARGRSFRTRKVAPLIRDHEDAVMVRARVASDADLEHEVGLRKTRSGETKLSLDGAAQTKASGLARLLPVHTLLPDSGELLFGGPGLRRGFLDWGLFHVEPRFLEVSTRYRRVLSQRNAWIKSAEGDGSLDFGMDPWAEQLLALGTALCVQRDQYLEWLQPHFDTMIGRLAPELSVSLEHYWGGLESPDLAQKKLVESWSRDVKFGSTHRGPHRGDLRILLSSGEGSQASLQDAADNVSRGQAKLIASAAILAQAELLREASGTHCVFLIDDFGAELDREHWQMFLAALVELECQVIATSTEPVEADSTALAPLSKWAPEGWRAEMAVFHVEQGRVEPRKQ